MSATFPGFWGDLARPIIGLAPMDGVTDFAFRYITARHGKPDVMFTEFTNVTGLFYAPDRILRDFEYGEMERPIVAQIYGANPDDFYKATLAVCELGFDGIDINMGCPAKNVVRQNCGARLILAPHLALTILKSVRAAIHDWANGQTSEQLGVPASVMERVYRMNRRRTGEETPAKRRIIPYSVKTRIGYDKVVIESWAETLLTENPAAISIHGRTLKQMYTGRADWDAIARAARIIHRTQTLVVGNGDIANRTEAEQRIAESGVDGALIGRSAIGNPWVFQKSHPGVERTARLNTALEHCDYFRSFMGEMAMKHLNKHLVAYLRNFPDAASLRAAVVQAGNYETLGRLLGKAVFDLPMQI